MREVLVFTVLLLSLAGCGGGGGSSSQPESTSTDESDSTPKDVTSTLLDSAISGVDFSCENSSGVTDENGQFTCKEGSSVTFTVGGTTLGSTTISAATTDITPAVLYDLDADDITDPRLLNFIRYMQALDSDSDPDNGIDINDTVKNALTAELSLADSDLDETAMQNALDDIGRILTKKHAALAHYTQTLSSDLDITLPKEPYHTRQWHLYKDNSFYTDNAIDADAGLDAEHFLQAYKGKGVTIAVIDDGLDTSHPELQNTVAETYNISTGDGDVSHDGSDDFHGTAVTGIIAAAQNNEGIRGIAPQARVIFLKHKPYMTDSETIALFEKAEELGADIINASWGTYDVSTAVKDTIVNLARNGRDGKGTIITFAAGNDDRLMGNDESAIPEVIAVGATDEENLRAAYSNYGPYLDVMAPGGYRYGITTLDPKDDYLLHDDDNAFTGTSAAAPIVSGVIALLLEQDPQLTRTEVMQKLQESSDKIGSVVYSDGRNDYYGYGKLNLQSLF